MRSSLLALFVCVCCCRATLAAPVVEHGEHETAASNFDKREGTTATIATTDTASQDTATTTATQAAIVTATTATDTAASHTNHITHAATTVPSLDGSSTSGNSAPPNITKPAYTGGQPIQPELTPALGVGGFILLVLGGALALIGIRKQWYVNQGGGEENRGLTPNRLYTFLSTAFLAALGVTVSPSLGLTINRNSRLIASL